MSRDGLTLPWVVLLPDNARHGLMGGRILLTSKYRNALAAASTLARASWRQQPLEKAVALRVTLYEPDRRRRDLSNYLKLIQDALTGVCYVDDSQIDRVEVVRGGIDRKEPRAEIAVTLL